MNDRIWADGKSGTDVGYCPFCGAHGIEAYEEFYYCPSCANAFNVELASRGPMTPWEKMKLVRTIEACRDYDEEREVEPGREEG